jgi:hypothetical protein
MQTVFCKIPRLLTPIRLDGLLTDPWTAPQLAANLNVPVEQLPALLAATNWTIAVRSSSHTSSRMGKWYRPGRVWLRGVAIIDTPRVAKREVRVYAQHRAWVDLRYTGERCYASRAVAAAAALAAKLNAAAGDVDAVIAALN